MKNPIGALALAALLTCGNPMRTAKACTGHQMHPQQTSDFKAVFTFPGVQYATDVHLGLVLIRTDNTVQYSLSSLTLQPGAGLSVSRDMNGIDLATVKDLYIRCQQGYTYSSPVNMFKVYATQDGAPVLDAFYSGGAGNSFERYIINN